MKHIFLISLAVFALSACSENDEFSTDQDRLEGFWILTDVTGGIAGTGYEVDFDHLQINKDRYALMVHDSFIQEGTYQLRKENGQLFIRFIPSMADAIVFDDHEKSIIFSEQDSQLMLADPCCDLFVYYFGKEGN